MAQNRDNGGSDMYKLIRALTGLILVVFVIGVLTGLIKLNIDLSGIKGPDLSQPAAQGLQVLVNGTPAAPITQAPESTQAWTTATMQPRDTPQPQPTEAAILPTATVAAGAATEASTPTYQALPAPTVAISTDAPQPTQAPPPTEMPRPTQAPQAQAQAQTYTADLIDGESGAPIRRWTYQVCTVDLLASIPGTDCIAADPTKAMGYTGLTGRCNAVWIGAKPSVDTNLWVDGGGCAPGDYKKQEGL